jgi:hypothetical protein
MTFPYVCHSLIHFLKIKTDTYIDKDFKERKKLLQLMRFNLPEQACGKCAETHRVSWITCGSFFFLAAAALPSPIVKMICEQNKV